MLSEHRERDLSLKSIRRQLERHDAQANQTKKFDLCEGPPHVKGNVNARGLVGTEIKWGRARAVRGRETLHWRETQTKVRDGVAVAVGTRFVFDAWNCNANETCGDIGRV